MTYKVVLKKNHKVLPNCFIDLKSAVAFIATNFLEAFIIVEE